MFFEYIQYNNIFYIQNLFDKTWNIDENILKTNTKTN